MEQIGKFSKKDAKSYLEYENWLSHLRNIVPHLLDSIPPNASNWKEAIGLLKTANHEKHHLLSFYELMTAPATTILDRWFESDILKTTPATDAVVGAMLSPSQPGSAYILFHHVMGESDGQQGVWAYLEGGMGALSNSIAESAKSNGAEIRTNSSVKKILLSDESKAIGVELMDGSKIESKIVLSNCTPQRTFVEFIPDEFDWSKVTKTGRNSFINHIKNIDYSCGAFKINCAINELPNFTCAPTPKDGSPGIHHRGTIHFESKMIEIEEAFRDAICGKPARRPVIEIYPLC
uniref:Pyridine nucleotide-disulfide oxidoreductase domain-containing protein 2 n=1 Tax=Hirondellea gigas TaxID=1518452 RepID=A0A6A7GA50_9CRUS